ncbi:MAG: DsrH/TusB family sulfur metabolism protein, partial [Sulfurimicrobium sp.]|nr:DsrH/TusB family sulfur metabolism protein [Sulfurimicrobium sp.]
MLHIVNKSPLERNALDSALRMIKPGSTILLIEDAVYAVT